MTNPITKFTYIGVPDPEHNGIARLAGNNFNRSWCHGTKMDGTGVYMYLYHGDTVWHDVVVPLRQHPLQST